jgi:hypothetical protein
MARPVMARPVMARPVMDRPARIPIGRANMTARTRRSLAKGTHGRCVHMRGDMGTALGDDRGDIHLRRRRGHAGIWEIFSIQP